MKNARLARVVLCLGLVLTMLFSFCGLANAVPADGQRTDTAAVSVDASGETTSDGTPAVDKADGDKTADDKAPASDEASGVDKASEDNAAVDEATEDNEPAVDEASKDNEPAVDEAPKEDEPAVDETPEEDEPAVDETPKEDEPAVDETPEEDEPTVEDPNTDDMDMDYIPELDDGGVDIDDVPDNSGSGSSGGYDIIMPDTGNQNSAFYDYLDLIKKWDFTDINVYHVLVDSGVYQALDGFNGIDDCPLRMANFGYDPDYDTYFDFCDLSLDHIMGKMDDMGINSMSDLADWIVDEPLAYMPNLIGLFDQTMGDKKNPNQTKIYVVARDGNSRFSTNYDNNNALFTGSSSVTDLIITPSKGLKISAVEARTDSSSTVAAYIWDSEGSKRSLLRNICTVKSCEKDGNFKITGDEFNRKEEDAKTASNLIYFLAATAADDYDYETFTSTITTTLTLVVTTERATVGKITFIEDTTSKTNAGITSDSAATFTVSANTTATVHGISELNTSVNGMLGDELRPVYAGDTINVTFDPKVIAGFAVSGGNGVKVSINESSNTGILNITAGSKDTYIAAIYKPHSGGLSITDTDNSDGGPHTDANFFNKYNVTDVAVQTSNDGAERHFSSYNDMQNHLKTAYDGDQISSITFTFGGNDIIENASSGTLAKSGPYTNRRITGIPLTGPKLNLAENSGGNNGVASGTWGKNNESFTAEWDKSNPEQTLTLTMANYQPTIAFSAYTATGAGLKDNTDGVVVVAEAEMGNSDWNGANMTLTGEFTGTGEGEKENPNYPGSKYGTLPTIKEGEIRKGKNYWGYFFYPDNGYQILYEYKATVNATVEAAGGTVKGSVDVVINPSTGIHTYVAPTLSNPQNATIKKTP